MFGAQGREWLERFYQQLALELRRRGWSQIAIAEFTGSTQSTISRLMSKSAIPLESTVDEDTIDGWANELAEALENVDDPMRILRQRMIFEIQFGDQQTFRFDKSLVGKHIQAGQEEQALLRRLTWAVSKFDAERLQKYMPTVGMNLAACTPLATEIEHIAAFPGRITLLEGELVHANSPLFGGSKHLASVLQQARKYDSNVLAITNIKPPMLERVVDTTEVEFVCDELGLNLLMAPRGIVEATNLSEIDVLLDVGDFGWEPSLFILGNNPLEVVERCHQMIDEFDTE